MATVTNSPLAVYNTSAAVTFSAATATAANATETMAITLTRPGSRAVILITEGAGTTDTGTMTYSIGAGTTEHFGSGAAVTGSVATASTKAMVLNTAQFSQSGVINITLTPTTGQSLETVNAATVAVIELPF